MSSRSGKSQGISLRVRKNLRLTEVRKKWNICTFYGHESCCIGRIFFMKFEDGNVGFWIFQFFLHVILRNYRFIYTARDLLKAVIYGWGMAEKGALSPLSGLISEIVNSLGQGNFTVVLKRHGKVRGFQKPLAVATIHLYWHFFIARIFYGVSKTCVFGALTISEDCICQF